jgi:hypothetical protein
MILHFPRSHDSNEMDLVSLIRVKKLVKLILTGQDDQSFNCNLVIID